jgi:hypothetical protein
MARLAVAVASTSSRESRAAGRGRWCYALGRGMDLGMDEDYRAGMKMRSLGIRTTTRVAANRASTPVFSSCLSLYEMLMTLLLGEYPRNDTQDLYVIHEDYFRTLSGARLTLTPTSTTTNTNASTISREWGDSSSLGVCTTDANYPYL